VIIKPRIGGITSQKQSRSVAGLWGNPSMFCTCEPLKNLVDKGLRRQKWTFSLAINP